jgi:anti-sigma regulatory factor (Ser/Thr protein kinase)
VEIVWRIPARFEELSAIRRAVRAQLAAAGGDDESVRLGELAAGEIVGNAIDHGSGAEVDVDLTVASGTAILTVINEGSAFTPVDVHLPRMHHQERGRGIAILRAFGCDVQVDCPAHGRCRVRVELPLHRGRPAPG